MVSEDYTRLRRGINGEWRITRDWRRGINGEWRITRDWRRGINGE